MIGLITNGEFPQNSRRLELSSCFKVPEISDMTGGWFSHSDNEYLEIEKVTDRYKLLAL
ncbi:hypothetical protein ES705_14919 [subsurface metagenome]